VRLLGVDCPEIGRGARCDQERRLAGQAKDATVAMLRAAKSIRVEEARPDKYFRVVGRLMVDGVDVGAMLLRKRLAVEYTGGTRSATTWCNKVL